MASALGTRDALHGLLPPFRPISAVHRPAGGQGCINRLLCQALVWAGALPNSRRNN